MSVLDTTPNRNNNYTIGDGLTVVNANLQINLSDNVDNIASFDSNKLYVPGNPIPNIKPMIQVTIIPVSQGVQITLTKGTYSTQASTNENGIVEFEVDHFGQYTVSGTINDKSVSKNVVVDSVERYEIYLAGVNVYGVAWDKNNPSPQLTRLTPENDVNRYCTNVIDGEPQPAIGLDTGSSPCDTLYPWSNIYCCNLSTNGLEIAKLGDDNFSYSTAEVMVHIPTFYYRIIDTEQYRYYYISDRQSSGFELHPGSNKYVSRYPVGSAFTAVSGVAPRCNTDRPSFRSNITAKGTRWYVQDYASWCAIWLLYLVEYATWDSQNAIGIGICGARNILPNGATDSMTYHTGKASDDPHSAIQYRYFENIWGNVRNLLDGFNANYTAGFINLDPETFADGTTEHYTNCGMILSGNNGGYISSLGYSDEFPWAYLPTATAGSSTTYTTDIRNLINGEWRPLWVGGDRSASAEMGSGMFLFDTYYSNGGGSGSRSMYIPQEVTA